MRRTFTLSLIVLSCLCLLIPGGVARAGEAVFTVTRAEGEVLHVRDGQSPKALQAGDKVVGGRLAIMEDSSADVVFPDGKSYPVPQNTLLSLDPTATTLENACAAAGGIRDQSALVLVPGENQELPAGQPFSAVVAVNPAAVKEATLALCLTTLDDIDCKKGKTLVEVPMTSGPGAKPGLGDFRLYRVQVPKAPANPGDYRLFLKTVAGVASRKVGKDQPVIVPEP